MLPKKYLMPPLVVDPDKDFLKSLDATIVKKQGLEFTFADKSKEAQLIITDTRTQLSAIFISLAVSNPDWIQLIRFVHQYRPGLPAYIIYDNELHVSEKDLKSIGVHKALKKPITYEQIVTLISPKTAIFDAVSTLAEGQKNTDVVDAEVQSEDVEFVPIRATDFISGNISYFDVYVRIQTAKYLKILQSGDSFSAERLKSYIQKNVNHFYIRKEAQKHYINYCDQLAAALINSNKVSVEIKSSQTRNHGEETLKFLEQNNIDQPSIQLAVNFIQNVDVLAKQLELDNNSAVKNYLSDITSYSHSVGVAMIASLLTKPLKINSFDPVEAIGLTCLLHDIGLKHITPIIETEDESKMTEAQKTVYKTHPKVGAEILSKLPKIKPIIIQAVSQHHERRNKKGFPDGIGAGSISLVAEIVGLSDEYLRILQKQKDNPKLNLTFEVESKIFHSFSQSLVNEFKKIFGFTSSDITKI